MTQVAKNEELGLELVSLMNMKDKMQKDKEAVEIERMQVSQTPTLLVPWVGHLFWYLVYVATTYMCEKGENMEFIV